MRYKKKEKKRKYFELFSISSSCNRNEKSPATYSLLHNQETNKHEKINTYALLRVNPVNHPRPCPANRYGSNSGHSYPMTLRGGASYERLGMLWNQLRKRHENMTENRKQRERAKWFNWSTRNKFTTHPCHETASVWEINKVTVRELYCVCAWKRGRERKAEKGGEWQGRENPHIAVRERHSPPYSLASAHERCKHLRPHVRGRRQPLHI